MLKGKAGVRYSHLFMVNQKAMVTAVLRSSECMTLDASLLVQNERCAQCRQCTQMDPRWW